MRFAWLVVLALCAVVRGDQTPAGMDHLRGMADAYLKVPDGYSVYPYSPGPSGARSLAISAAGNLFVTSDGAASAVYVIRDLDGDGYAETVQAVTAVAPSGGVHAMDVLNGTLYATTIDSIWRFPNIDAQVGATTPPLAWNNPVATGIMPTIGGHSRRYMKISPAPENKIYVTVGTPCNTVCSPIGYYLRINLDGTGMETIANGVRSSVGLAFHPLSPTTMFFTDNGRDQLGDNFPPDELNRLITTAPAANYGHPYCLAYNYADSQSNPNCTDGVCPSNACDGYTAMNYAMYAHGAALGIRFYTHTAFDGYQNQAFIAHHGSWNRQPMIGYCVTAVRFDNTIDPPTAVGMENFLWGFLPNNETIPCTVTANCPNGLQCNAGHCYPFGRPADVEVLLDGSLVVSDDANGMLWRVVKGPHPPYPPPSPPPNAANGVHTPLAIVVAVVAAAATLLANLA